MAKRKILWADDDPDDLMLMRQVLQELDSNYEIVEVNNGREALDYLQEASATNKLPCLLILDMNMPIMDGKETLAQIKADEKLKDLSIVVFTTSNSKLDKLFCQKHNVEMVTKPPNYVNLTEAVKKLLTFCGA